MYTLQWVKYTEVIGDERQGWGIDDLSVEWVAEVPNLDDSTLFDLLIGKGAIPTDAVTSNYFLDNAFTDHIALDLGEAQFPVGRLEILSQSTTTYEVWRIDAWRNDEEGWLWNDRAKVGEYTTMGAEDYGRAFFQFLFDKGMKQECYIEFDWYSENECEALNSETREPLFQIIEKQ